MRRDMSSKWFRYRLPEVLQELYFVATKEGKIKTLKEAKRWLNAGGCSAGGCQAVEGHQASA